LEGVRRDGARRKGCWTPAHMEILRRIMRACCIAYARRASR